MYGRSRYDGRSAPLEPVHANGWLIWLVGAAPLYVQRGGKTNGAGLAPRPAAHNYGSTGSHKMGDAKSTPLASCSVGTLPGRQRQSSPGFSSV